MCWILSVILSYHTTGSSSANQTMTHLNVFVNNIHYIYIYIQCVPLATEPDISLIILTPIKTLQRNLNRSTFVV